MVLGCHWERSRWKLLVEPESLHEFAEPFIAAQEWLWLLWGRFRNERRSATRHHLANSRN